MALQNRMELQYRQELTINPRLYQAMDLLQMPLLDLQAHLKQELLVNPFLELAEESEEGVETTDEVSAEESEEEPSEDSEAEAVKEELSEPEEKDGDDDQDVSFGEDDPVAEGVESSFDDYSEDGDLTTKTQEEVNWDEILDENDVLFICDEIQTGFGRTGKMFAIEYYGVKPDIVTLAKAIAGGLPLGAFISKSHIAEALTPGEHFSTFGGNLVSCMAALANLEILRKENLVRNAERVGGYLLKRFSEMMEAHRLIGDVRGKGLMIGIELVKDKDSKKPAKDEAEKVILEALKHRVLVGVGGIEGNVLRVKPPLVITMEQAEKVAEALDEALTTVEREAL